MDKYGTGQDPYCYANTSVLINSLSICDEAALEEAELTISALAAEDIAFQGPPYDFKYWCSLHKALFGEIYPWAGEPRTIDVSRQSTRFCSAQYVEGEAAKIFQRAAKENFYVDYGFASLVQAFAETYCDLNMVHPFREGNGRAQRLLFEHWAIHCGYHLNLAPVSRQEWLKANIAGVYCDYQLMEIIFAKALT